MWATTFWVCGAGDGIYLPCKYSIPWVTSPVPDYFLKQTKASNLKYFIKYKHVYEVIMYLHSIIFTWFTYYIACFSTFFFTIYYICTKCVCVCVSFIVAQNCMSEDDYRPCNILRTFFRSGADGQVLSLQLFGSWVQSINLGPALEHKWVGHCLKDSKK